MMQLTFPRPHRCGPDRPAGSARLLSALAFCLLVTVGGAHAEAPRSELTGVQPAHWRVIWTYDAAREATIAWDTAKPGEKHRVYYDTESRDGETSAYAHQADAARSGRYTTTKAEEQDLEAHYHHVELRDLKPDTTYYFVMASDDEVSPEFHFQTAPVEDQSFRLLYGGDSRSDPEQRRNVNRLMARLAKDNPDILALIHGGDYIADGQDLRQWLQWLHDHELTVTEDRRIVPVIPAYGNHDVGKIYGEVFNEPGGENYYFTTSLGPQARLITLNTEISIAGDQAQWLEQELEEGRGEVRWLLAQYHRPAFPAVKKPSGARQHWIPLFEKYNVDLVMESDGHVLKRTIPIRDEGYDPTGVTYIGEGGLGVKQRRPRTNRWFLQPPGFADSIHHVHLLSFSDEVLRLQAVLLDYTIADDWILAPRVLEKQTESAAAP